MKFVILKIYLTCPYLIILKMLVQEQFRKKNKPVNIKAVFDIVMGLVYAGVGAMLVLSKYMGLDITFPPPKIITIFGAFAFLYGCFRVYRGVKTYNA